MKGDFTRNTYTGRKHYSRVLMQQGRVQVDADWNEQLAIDAHIDRTARRDVIGHCGGPQGTAPDGTPLAGFEIIPQGSDLRITAGRYYVDGILVENEAEHLYTAQPDYREAALPTAPGTYLLYLDVWERHVTALEDPAIREVALGGPDTATRARVLGQVKWQAIGAGDDCKDFGPGWVPDGAASTGRLAARAEPDPAGTTPCIVPEEAGYRRLENQLYRVEIHTPGALGTATFKWSRENGSVVTGWVGQDGDTLTVGSTGRDEVLGFANEGWIELTDEVREMAGTPGTLVMILSVTGDTITIDPTTATGTTDLANFDAATAKIRRWDSDGADVATVPATNDGWIGLEDGVEIKFGAGTFQTGDYWLIPARTLTHDVEWDTAAGTGPEGFQLRHGIDHHYCPLAIGPLTANGWGSLTSCRRLFPPLTEIDRGASCCTVTVGDGVTSAGDYDDIQEAVDSLLDEGRVCVLAGVYRLRAPVRIRGRDVAITGCGRGTAILAPDGQPAFAIRGGEVELRGLTIAGSCEAGLVVAEGSEGLTVAECRIVNRGEGAGREWTHHRTHRRRVLAGDRAGTMGAAGGPAITVAGEADDVTIRENQLFGHPAVLCQARGARVAENEVLGGGVWIADGSAAIEVTGNAISRGAGAGVILGGAPKGVKLSERETGVETALIAGNTITAMADSGIASAGEVAENLELGELADIEIRGNTIRHCAPGGPNPAYDPTAAGGIVLRNVVDLRIADNLITDNGGEGGPACGIFTHFCTGLQVTGNTIADNGSPGEAGGEGARAYQAGIAALYVVGGDVGDAAAGAPLGQAAGPAALIHDNVVVCPRGQALIAGALGPASIAGNTLTSGGPRLQPKVGADDLLSALAVLGGAVFLVNLGRTPGFGGAAAGSAATVGTHRTHAGARRTFGATAFPDGRTLFHGNQVTLEASDDDPFYVVSTATLVSFGDLSIADNQVLTKLVGGVVLSSVVALAVTVRAHGNRMHELPLRAFASYLSVGLLMNNATGNQGTHCIGVGGALRVDEANQVLVTTWCEAFKATGGAGLAAMPTVGVGRYAVVTEEVIARE